MEVTAKEMTVGRTVTLAMLAVSAMLEESWRLVRGQGWCLPQHVSTAQHFFTGFLVPLSGGRSGSDRAVGACGCSGNEAGIGRVKMCDAAVGLMLLVALLCWRWCLLAGMETER
jgi:hypothetical protein